MFVVVRCRWWLSVVRCSLLLVRCWCCWLVLLVCLVVCCWFVLVYVAFAVACLLSGVMADCPCVLSFVADVLCF